MSATTTPTLPYRVNFKSSRQTQRKPQAKTLVLFGRILSITDEYARMSVRQLFYQMVVRGHVEKTEHAYKRVADATVAMRRTKRLPYSKIVDGGRVRRRLPGWESIGDLLEQAERQFRLDHWGHQPELVEIWCEKLGLTGVITPVTDEYGVTFVPLGGFGSATIAAESAEELRLVGKPVNIYYFGDHDPSGWAVSQAIEAELRNHLADDLLHFRRVALTPEDVRLFKLPTRPPKKGDTRLPAFVDAFGTAECVELDALPPDVLTAMVRENIERHIDWGSWARVERAEAAQRTSLEDFIAKFDGLEEVEV
jgi:hypothetical protein